MRIPPRGKPALEAALVIGGLTLVFGFAYIMWLTGRRIHYAFAYESMVRETISEMVKAEALKP